MRFDGKNTLNSILSIAMLLLTTVFARADVAPITTQGNQLLFGGSPDTVVGPSLFWSNNGWGGEKFYNAGAVASVAGDWNAELIRAAMGVEEPGGYLDDPSANLQRVRAVVDAAIANDMYVIIDWHSHHAENHTRQAIEFFQQMATEYGEYNNVIYEIYNEPLAVSWSGTIKPYARQVIGAIRAIDPDNLIVVGTPNWSQDVDAAANDPITAYNNIAYTLHFYAGTHGQWLRDKARRALDSGIALFATEWGTVNANGDGGVAYNATDTWMSFFKTHGISHANWALNDKAEGASALVPGANVNGSWPDSQYTASGTYVRDIVRQWSGGGQTNDCPAVTLPAQIEAEDYCSMSGVQTESTTDAGGGANVGWIETGDTLSYRINVPAGGLYAIDYRVASNTNGTYFQLEDANTGHVLNVVQSPATGGWQNWETVSTQVDLSAGGQTLTLRALGDGWNINWLSISEFGGSSSSQSSTGSGSSSSASSSSSSAGAGCANPVDSGGSTMQVSEGDCISYHHGNGQLRLGSWSAVSGTVYDITNCNGQVIADVVQTVNGFTAVETGTQNCAHKIHVKRAPQSYSLQFGSW